MEIFLNPKFLISLVLVLNCCIYVLHFNTYNAAQGLYELVEREIKIKVANR